MPGYGEGRDASDRLKQILRELRPPYVGPGRWEIESGADLPAELAEFVETEPFEEADIRNALDLIAEFRSQALRRPPIESVADYVSVLQVEADIARQSKDQSHQFFLLRMLLLGLLTLTLLCVLLGAFAPDPQARENAWKAATLFGGMLIGAVAGGTAANAGKKKTG